MSVILDASVTLSWLFDDEAAAQTDVVIDRVVAEGASVPSVWRLEVTNGLNVAIRRKRIDVAFRTRAILDLARLPIAVDPETDSRVWKDTLDLADRFALTIYDSAYLELAKRLGAPLSSLDRELCRAARKLGVPLIGV